MAYDNCGICDDGEKLKKLRKKWREAEKDKDTIYADMNRIVPELHQEIADLRVCLEEALHKSQHDYAMKLEARLEEAEAMLSDAERRLLEHRDRAEEAEEHLANSRMASKEWKARAEKAEARVKELGQQLFDMATMVNEVQEADSIARVTAAGNMRDAAARIRELEDNFRLATKAIADNKARALKAEEDATVHRKAFAAECRNREHAEARIRELEEALLAIQHCVDEQADDEGLWFLAPTAAEAYVQQGLRRLHACVEEVSDG